MIRTTPSRLFVFASGWLIVATVAVAQTYPTKIVKITAPYSAGAGPAVFTRVMAEKLSRAWSQQVLVDPRPGASGFIAIESVKNAAPDGHELLVVSNAHVAINPALYKKLPYDPDKDFVPVAMFYRTPFFLTVATAGPYQNVRALIDAAKAKPGTVSYGSSYVGSPSHLGSAEFEFLTGTKMIHVPFKDQSQMYVSIANGDVGWAFSTLGSALPLIQSNKIKLIAIAAKVRLKTLPDVPTVEEAGGPAGFEVGSWLALMAPRGTPPDVIQRINAEVNRQLVDPEVKLQLQTFGFDAAPGTPEQLTETIRVEAKKYGELVRRTGATAE
ncbi:MAG TPA: tripartite tricarboxylate transporter substrate-binding protein [Casimicrobiaceae bacterium]|jgi:tripartite-type tricarboxylate transporter receptor subunit TctC